jgi:hypothetical protein
MFKKQRFNVFHDQSDDKGVPSFYVVLPATSDSYEIAELKIKALGLSVGKRGSLNRGIPYVGRRIQHASFIHSKEEIRLFLHAVRYGPFANHEAYDYNSAIVHHPLSDDYFKLRSYDEPMRQITSASNFRIWKESLFGYLT